MRVIFGDVNVGTKGVTKDGQEFHYIFSYAAGGPVSFTTCGREWLYRAPRPAFWRALTDNDRGCGFHLASGVWMAADMFIRTVSVSEELDGERIPQEAFLSPGNNRFGDEIEAETFRITYEYQTITNPAANVSVCYTVSSDGGILVDAKYFGAPGLPELPLFGMRFVMPTAADGFTYEGLSGETYPDRKLGASEGVFEVKGMPITPYLVPQECGMHVDTKWVEVTRSSTSGNEIAGGKAASDAVTQGNDRTPFTLRIEQEGGPFAFSCLPYTPQEIESATHWEELPPVRRTVLTVCGALRGVGGINSWGADVQPEYHVSGEESLAFSFRIRPAAV